MNLGIPAQLDGSAVGEPKSLSMVHGVQRTSDTTESQSELFGSREKAIARPTPRADRCAGFDFQIRHRVRPVTGPGEGLTQRGDSGPQRIPSECFR